MNKLWAVLYIFGNLSVVVGPLPYDEDECWSRLPFLASFERGWAEGKKPEIDGREITRDDISQWCVRSPTRPTAPGKWHDLGGGR